VLVVLVAGSVTAGLLALQSGRRARLAQANEAAAQRAAGQARDAADAATTAEGGARQKAADEEKARKETEKQRDGAGWEAHTSRLALALREWEAGNPEIARDILELVRWDLRDWEYRHLYTLAHAGYFRYPNVNQLSDVAVSPDGRRFAV